MPKHRPKPVGPKPYSSTPEYRRRKKISEEFSVLLRAEGYGTLFPNDGAFAAKTNARRALARTRLIQQAIEFGMLVPQLMVDQVNPPVEPNPRVPPSDPNEAPF